MSAYLSRVVWDHPRAYSNGCVSVHILIAEEALGHHLPKGVVIHHVNGNKADNSPGNLVICENARYHKELHRRQYALMACSHPTWRTCVRCRKWSLPEELFQTGPTGWAHRACENTYQAKRMYRQRTGTERGW